MEESAYKKAYLHLFNEVTDIIERLKEVQQETEEIFMSNENYEETE